MRKLLESIRWRVNTARHRISILRFRKRSQPPATAADPSSLDQQLVRGLAGPQRLKLNQLRHVGRVLSAAERRQIRLLAVIAAASLAYLGVSWAARHITSVPVAKGKYTEGLIGAPVYINPLLAENDVDRDLASLVYAGLFRYDAELKPVPDLAAAYRVSDDKKSYVVQLKAGLRWHDGQPVTPEDVVFTYTIAQDPQFASPLRWSLNGIKVTKSGDHEITFQLPEPHERFLELLTTGLLPEHLWGEIPAIHSRLTEYNLGKPIGSGPWRLQSLAKERRGNIVSYTLVPFADAARPKPYLQEITFRFYPTARDAAVALKNRNVDGVSYVDEASEAVLADTSIHRFALRLPQYNAVFFNQQAAPALQDRRVRQALAQAIDREQLLTEAVKLRGELAEGPILPGLPGYDPELKSPAYDPAAAGSLLDAAGWTEATSTPAADGLATSTPDGTPAAPPGRRNAAGASLELALTTVDLPQHVDVANAIAGSWQAIGVKTTMIAVPQERILREIIKPRNYQAFLYGELIGTDPDPYAFWHSSQTVDPGLNLAIVANRQLDTLLEEARADDPNTRAEKYREFARLLNAEIPAIFLYTPLYHYAQHQRIKGFSRSQINLPQDRFIDLHEWYVTTRWRWR